METIEPNRRETPIQEIIDSVDSFNKSFLGTTLILLHVSHDENIPDGEVIYKTEGNVIFAKTYMVKRNPKFNDDVNKKNLLKVLSFIFIKDKYKNIFKRKVSQLLKINSKLPSYIVEN